jgi:hypothetical protein
MNTNMKIEHDKQSASLQSQMSAAAMANSLDSYKLIEQHRVEGTPFTIVEVNNGEEENTFISVGNKRVTELMPKKLAEETVQAKDWNLIVSVVTIILESMLDDLHRTAVQAGTSQEGKK